MKVQEAVKQTLDIYKDEDEYQSIDNAMDYLLQLLKVDDEQRIKKAVYDATHAKHDTREPYMSGYRAGWNDALHEIKCSLLDGVSGKHWLAQEVIKATSFIKRL